MKADEMKKNSVVCMYDHLLLFRWFGRLTGRIVGHLAEVEWYWWPINTFEDMLDLKAVYKLKE